MDVSRSGSICTKVRLLAAWVQELGHLLRTVGENPTESEIGVRPPGLAGHHSFLPPH